MSRWTKAELWEEATQCVSDLETIETEIDNLQKVAPVSQIHALQKASRLIAEAVECLMNELDNK